jgi:hypothetical protein
VTLVVLASRHDQTVGGLVAGWDDEASILTSRDLCAEGWWHCPHGELGESVIGGRLSRADQIDGVLSRLPSVAPSELGEIHPGDRPYVAAEMTAFLSAWLSGLRCPVLNRPTAQSLMGPYWRTEKWVLTAAKLGIPVVTARRSVPAPMDDAPADLLASSTEVSVVGQRCLGDADPSLRQWTTALAAEAGVGLLRARFTTTDAGAAFLDADYWVDIANPEVSEAIVAYFAEKRHR